MKVLTLSLKRKWFDMIAAGIKKEEYREMKPYWKNRFLVAHNGWCYVFNKFDAVEFTLGYPPKDDTSRRMRFEIEHIRIGAGVPEWGAESGKNYFVIKLGNRI